MSLLSLLFFIYLLLIPLVIAGLGMWLWRYMSRLNYTQEKRILLTLIMTACLTFVAFSLGIKLNKQRMILPANSTEPTETAVPKTPEITVPPQHKQREAIAYPSNKAGPLLQNQSQADQLHLFETSHFPELYKQRVALNSDIRDLEGFLQRIRALAEKTPKQYALLEKIALIRYSSYKKLKQRNISVSQHLRDFWVHYNTGNSHDAIKKFTPLAEQLIQKIKETRSELSSNKRREAQVISNTMKQAGGSLKRHTVPGHQAGKITAYTRQNRELITAWLHEKGSMDISDVLNELVEQRKLINDRIRQIQSYRQLYPDLDKRLARTEQLWTQARDSNYYAEYRLLYATETRYVVEYMNLASKTADARLDKELSTYTRSIAKHADAALEKAEQAYQPARVQ
ncbi:MAG: hypothetical protein CSA79_04385 [Thiothrix nivea]|nr:MAG: hypothetical protein CSA79_04385 [Thiothrix nivea]